MRSVSNDRVPASLQNRVESPVRQIAEIGGWSDHSKCHPCLAARSANRIDRALFGVVEFSQAPGVTPLKGRHQNDVFCAGANCFKPEANICIPVDSPKVVDRVDMQVPRCHARDGGLRARQRLSIGLYAGSVNKSECCAQTLSLT